MDLSASSRRKATCTLCLNERERMLSVILSSKLCRKVPLDGVGQAALIQLPSRCPCLRARTPIHPSTVLRFVDWIRCHALSPFQCLIKNRRRLSGIFAAVSCCYISSPAISCSRPEFQAAGTHFVLFIQHIIIRFHWPAFLDGEVFNSCYNDSSTIIRGFDY